MREGTPGNSQDHAAKADRGRPSILALGGSTRAQSTSEAALRIAADGAVRAGADVQILGGRDLMLPIYDPDTSERAPEATRLLDLARAADGLIIVSPGYHGGLSGLVKNALDYMEDLREGRHPDRGSYLDGRAVGCIAVAHGWQAAVGTLHQLRQVAHALRGWPTPFGAVVNSSEIRLDDPDAVPEAVEQLHLVGRQVAEFAHMRLSYVGSRDGGRAS
jgi:FMN reductase